MLKITKMLFLAVLVMAFQSCSDDDTSTGSDGTVSVPTTYTFNGSDGASSVSYSGQVTRNMIISEIKSQIESGTTTEAKLVSLYNNNDASNTYGSSGFDFHTISGGCDAPYNGCTRLTNKISPAASVEGYTVTVGNYTGAPDALINSWMTDAATASVSDEGVHLNQMVGKGLLGMVSYYQGTTVYPLKIDQMNTAGTDYEYSNSDIVDGKNYTKVEHYWDEAFGYFGAARDYATQDRSNRKNSGTASTIDDYKEAINYDWAKYAAKRSDCSGCDTGDFDTKIMDAFTTGRAYISAGQRDEALPYREIIYTEWEKVVAANIVHYGNEVANFVTTGLAADASYDCSTSSDNCAKYWSEMRAFGLCMQFNGWSDFATSSDFTDMIARMGDAPPTNATGADFVTGVATTNTSFKTHFGFTDNDIDATNGF